ncbi:MAG TPA: type IV toxin-antitoxin system AbiEi family antitoxin domain-containing protein [Galbitalea sp.]|jgi:very-short-patch-repair endonuclease
MERLVSALRSLGGIAPTHELLALGYSPGVLYHAAKTGEILRPRKGWYASNTLPPDAIRAWRVGGRLTCLSAAQNYGLWVPELSRLHLEVPHSAARLRSPVDRHTRLAAMDEPPPVVHWRGRLSPGSRFSVSVMAAIDQIFRCQGDETGFVILESALNLGRLAQGDSVALVNSLPVLSRRLCRHANHLSDSGGESLLKLLLLRLGIPFRQQVLIANRWPVDFLLGEHLAIEADSKAFHSDPYRDRKKDAELSSAGVRVLRFMYSQIRYELPAVELAIVAALARGDANSA